MVTKRLKIAVWWERVEMPLRLAIFVLVASTLALIIYWQRPEFDIENFTSNLTFFILINLNIALLFVFIFLVSRNIIKLVFDRKHNILGSKLKGKLIFAFVGLTLVPTVIIFVLASGMLTRSMEEIFSKNILEAISGANDVAKNYYKILEKRYKNVANNLKLSIQDIGLKNKKQIELLFKKEKNRNLICNIFIVNKLGEKIIDINDDTKKCNIILNKSSLIEVNKTGKSKAVFKAMQNNQLIRLYYPLSLDNEKFIMVLTGYIDNSINNSLIQVEDSYKAYENLMFHKNPMRSGYLLTLAMITMLILFGAIWIAFYIAKEITIPIEKLANATKAVALGDYDYVIKIVGDDELSYLSRSFNTMISDLKQSKNETERHRLFMETVLSNLAVGVLTLNREKKLVAVNSAASDIFNIPSGEHFGTQSLSDIFDKDIANKLENLLTDSSLIQDEFNTGMADFEFTIRVEGREYQLVCTAGAIIDNSGDTLGNILIFDDITDLSHAQKMAAWREVARRIAHEIKNPLTPIKLSAQRIQKNAKQNNLPVLYNESSQMIVEQVDIIKRLIDEFSNFARMPTASFEKIDIIPFLNDIIMSFSENNEDITFLKNIEEDTLEVSLDMGQMRLVFLNLFENAMQALRNAKIEDPKIFVKLYYLKKKKSFSIEVADNGPGISDVDKTRIFEPYFTKKSSGTGLGLAIVTSVISDHRGRIRTFDNKPRGAKFIITLPVNQPEIRGAIRGSIV